ncbi:putative ribonuclease H-like domain-containing protein [Tanacetum coccineum]|uniref:Ribonuclease H-like domain-containing protein n=1 Tax=Tanacetum coccineum TaxID=301880 RepID=A0ABQ5I942_9ASTR
MPRGIVVKDKARLVCTGTRQEEGIDTMVDVRVLSFGECGSRSVWSQPKGFEDPYFPKHVYRVVKALYGLHQAPRAWYARLSAFLLQHNYRRGTIDKTLFIKKDSRDILLVQVYVDDIIFGSTNKAWCDDFEVLMKGEFEMSAMGEMTFFLGETDPPISACSRHQVTPLTSHLNAVKKIFKYLKGQPKLGLWYPKDSPFQLEAYSDSDYAGSHGDRKSTTGGCQFLGRRLISWQCKKQDYCGYFFKLSPVTNQSTICIVKNLYFHQRRGGGSKHIEIRHHFIRDANEKNLIQVLKIHTDDNVADLLTKAFDGPRFAYLVVHIGMVDMVLVSAGCTMVLLVVILPAGRMVSAGCTMVLLVVIFPAGRLVSAGCTMVLLVVIFPAGRLVSAGCTMVLLVVIFSADWFLLVVLWFCWKLLFPLPAGTLVSSWLILCPAGRYCTCWILVPLVANGQCC